MTLYAKTLLFLSSYAPLFALLAVRTSEDDEVATWAFGALAVTGLVALAAVLRAVLGRDPRPIEIVGVERVGEQTTAYIATYLLPFLTTTFLHWQDWVVFTGFLLFIGFIYVQSEMLYLNPLMSLLNYQVFRVRYRTADAGASDAAEDQMFLIAKRHLVRSGSRLEASRMGDEIAVAH